MSLLMPGANVAAGLIAGKPDLPRFIEVNPQAEQRNAIAGNIAALPGAQKLASSVNAFNRQQLDQMYQAAMPGFKDINELESQNIQAQLRGEFDVGDTARTAIAKSFGGGFAGSPMARNLVARDFGLTGYAVKAEGAKSADAWKRTMASLYQPGMFNVGSMFISPETQLATRINERNAKFQHDWNANLIDWQSSFGYLLGNQINQDDAQINSMFGSVAGSAGGAAAGGAMGSGGGGGGY